MRSETRGLAEFAATLRLADVPPDVVARAKAIILDGFACALFGAGLPWSSILRGVVRKLEPQGGCAAIWGCGESASPVHAALVNGTMLQGYELDDTHPATMHNCAAVLPAVISATEMIGAANVSGERLLTAVIAGFEIGPRVGLCVNGNRLLVRGWHTPGIFAPFPAAASAAMILGLDAERIYQALGIAGPQSAGIMAVQFGSMVKRMLSARGSQSGLYAALLAADGFTGAEDIFEQSYGGFCTTYTQSTDGFDLSELTGELGTRWETMRITTKRHSCCGTNLSTLDAIEDLVAETGLRAADVERVTVAVTESAISHSYWTPYEPTDLTAAQMHMGFCVAMKLIDGEVFVDQMVDGNIGRPDLVDLANRVDVVHDEAREARGRPLARGATVQVHMRNGATFEKTVDYFLGSGYRPMSDAQMTAKFRNLASRRLSPARVASIQDIVGNLERTPSMTGLVEALRG